MRQSSAKVRNAPGVRSRSNTDMGNATNPFLGSVSRIADTKPPSLRSKACSDSSALVLSKVRRRTVSKLTFYMMARVVAATRASCFSDRATCLRHRWMRLSHHGAIADYLILLRNDCCGVRASCLLPIPGRNTCGAPENRYTASNGGFDLLKPINRPHIARKAMTNVI